MQSQEPIGKQILYARWTMDVGGVSLDKRCGKVDEVRHGNGNI